MKDMQVYDEEDLHEKERNGLESVDYQNPKFDTMKKGDEDVKKKEKEEMVIEDGDMWLDGEADMLLDGQPEDLLEDSSIFYEDFPPLPDFPCISSSSSSSSPAPAPAPAPAPPNIIACSSSSSSSLSSSASSTAASNQDRYMQQHGQMDQPLLSTDSMEIPPFDHQMDFDCMDVMEELQDMNLLDTDDIWDPSSIFPYENPQEEQQEHQQQQHQQPRQQQGFVGHAGDQQSQEGSPSEDLAMVFFEWLKSNKESISAEDLRSIKLKRSTIECAARRLGGGKEGMKQLVKLILEWVQNHHLHKRRMQEGEASPYPYPQHPQHFHNSNPNPNFNCNAISPDSNPCFSPSTPWIQHQTVTGFPSMVGYMGDPMFANMNSNPYSPSPSYPMIGSSATWAPQHFSLAPHYNSYGDHHYPSAAPTPPQAFASYPNQYPCQLFQGQGEQLVQSGSSATKEARKKRMARQRRFLSHHRSKSQQQQQQQRQNSTVEQHARLAGDDNCTSAGHATPSNWMFWSDAPPPPGDRPPLQPQHRQISERRQGWKPEKNLKFLLQKVLKQSDVGNLGRIVLPKKEAETHLPELEARDGISIAMEDIGTSRVWNMRYRFWPNNKSRMYLLENTGDFVRSNGLQEGDFIVIYSDVKSGKYMIRGVKVRQPGLKMEVRRPGKTRRNLHASSTAVDGSSSSSIKETVT